MADINANVHPNCKCIIKDNGRWVFSGEVTTEKGNPSPCPICSRLGNAQNRRLGFMNIDESIEITFNQINIIKKYDGNCNCHTDS
jgi:hypothetical protein